MTLQRLKLALASVPPVWVLFLILESRVSLFIKFDEWFLPQVWMIDLTVWSLAPFIYCLPKSQKDTWRANLRIVYWIAFSVLTIVYGTIFMSLILKHYL